jgi:hypothetical protein
MQIAPGVYAVCVQTLEKAAPAFIKWAQLCRDGHRPVTQP